MGAAHVYKDVRAAVRKVDSGRTRRPTTRFQSIGRRG